MEYKDVVIDNDAIVNTEPRELPEEPQNIPQGAKPYLNPNPGYGEGGETKPAIKTDLVEGARGTPEIVGTPKTEGIKVEQSIINFLNGLLVKGKKIEDYIDSQGGVTEEELSVGDHIFSGDIKFDGFVDFTDAGGISGLSLGTKLYLHYLTCTSIDGSQSYTYRLISNESKKLSDFTQTTIIYLISGINDGTDTEVYNGFTISINYSLGKTVINISGAYKIIVGDNVTEL